MRKPIYYRITGDLVLDEEGNIEEGQYKEVVFRMIRDFLREKNIIDVDETIQRKFELRTPSLIEPGGRLFRMQRPRNGHIITSEGRRVQIECGSPTHNPTKVEIVISPWP